MSGNGNGRADDQARATYYALYLRALGYSPDEAAVLVRERYPGLRIPELRKPAAAPPEPQR